MDEMSELACRCLEVADIAGDKVEFWVVGQVRGLASKSLWITCQDSGMHTEVEVSICMAQAFQQPAADEAGASGDEQLGATQLWPDWGGLL